MTQGSIRPRSATAPTARATLSTPHPRARARQRFPVTTSRHDDRRGNVRDGGEHALIDGVEQIGDMGATDRGASQDVEEADVAQIPDVAAGGMGKGEGIAPKEPLEGDDGRGHDRQPDQRQGRLASGQTRIEESIEAKRDRGSVSRVPGGDD